MLDKIRTTQYHQFKPNDFLPFIRSHGAEKDIQLTQLDVKVLVTGLYAETIQTMTFYNDNPRNLEGELHFPMPDGATVCGYALDINGNMIDGVLVKKERARQILETEIRKGGASGLLETVAGNIYKTRIHPIPANGSRTVRIRYISDLIINGNDAAYHLPLSHAASINNVSVKIEVDQSTVKPELSGLGNTTFNVWNNRWVAEAKLSTTLLADEIVLQLPNIPNEIVSIEKFEDETFFVVSLKQENKNVNKWMPKHISIAWDASGSRILSGKTVQQSLQKEFDLLELLAGQVDEITYELIIFRNTVSEDIITFQSTAALIAHLTNIPYDGGTCLNSLDLSVLSSSLDGCFLFSDGLNSGVHTTPKKYSKPLITVTSQSKFNGAFLEYMAVQNSGVYINLLTMDIDCALAVIENVSTTPQIIEIEGCTDIYQNSINGRISVVGKITKENASITFAGKRKPTQLSTINFVEGKNISSAWAGLKAREVSIVTNDSDALLLIGEKYGIVTNETSLLVLDDIEQYIKHDIMPPSSLPELRRLFINNKRGKKLALQTFSERHLEQVSSWWQERKEWWSTDHKTDYMIAQLLSVDKELLADTTSDEASIDDEAIQLLYEMREEAPVQALYETCEEVACEPLCEPSDDVIELLCQRADKTEVTENHATASIQIKKWSADTLYLKELQSVDPDKQYERYIALRGEYALSPSFFLDCGNFFFEQNNIEIGRRVLSNLEELQLGDIALLRIYAWRLQQEKLYDEAVNLFERILKEREDEPQSHRDLALALIERWEVLGSESDALSAMALLYNVVRKKWDRFPEIEIIALVELNRFIYFATQKNITIPSNIDRSLIDNLDLDVRISLSWDADLTDVDLHVFEPSDGHAYYAHNRTSIGGLVSRDFTQGYGPEEYVIRNAMPGKYIIKAHYYGSHQQTIHGPCTVTATVFTNYGRSSERKQVMMLRLDEASAEQLVGEITLEGDLWELKANKAEPLLDQASELTKGLSFDAVVVKMGQPHKITGTKEITLIYELVDTSQIALEMSPTLSGIKHLTEGAVRTIL